MIYPTLNALYMEEPDVLQALLTRCCIPGSLLDARHASAAELDAVYNHERRKEKGGFVNPASAAVFLEASRDTELSLLLAATEYDLDTAAYFKRIARAVSQERNRPGPAKLELDGNAMEDPEYLPDQKNIQALQAAMAAIEPNEIAAPQALLTGPKDASQNRTPLQIKMDKLAAENPQQVSQRLAETAYLSNILMAGSQLGGKRFSQKHSVDAVFATCNLGLEYAPDISIAGQPGLIGVFRIGWHIIQALPPKVIRYTGELLRSKAAIEQLGVRAWIVSDLLKALMSPQTRADMELGRFENIHETLQMLNLVMDADAVFKLQLLVDHYPCVIARGKAGRVSQERRFISSKVDVAEIQAFLESLLENL